jgi:hypothetical protein
LGLQREIERPRQETSEPRRRRQDLGRGLAAILVSLAAHLILIGPLVPLLSLRLGLKLDPVWLDLDNTLGAPVPARKEVLPPPRPETTPPKKVRRKVAHKLKSKKKPQRPAAGRPQPSSKALPAPSAAPTLDPSQVNLHPIAPGQAALMLLVRTDRLRGTPYEASVRQLLAVFYDFKTLLWQGGLDVVNDFDAILIATPNPYRVTQTFVAARHKLDSRPLQEALERSTSVAGKRVGWQASSAGLRGVIPSPPLLAEDKRFLLLRPGLILLTDAERVSLLEQSPAPTADEKDETAPASPSLDGLSHFEQQAGVGAGDTLLLQAINLRRLMRLPPDLPTPDSAKAVIAISKLQSSISAHLTFPTELEATRFALVLPRYIERGRASLLLRLMGVAQMLDGIVLTTTAGRVALKQHLPHAGMKQFLLLLAGMIPQISVPGMPDRHPIDGGPPPSSGRTGSMRPDRGTSSEAAAPVKGDALPTGPARNDATVPDRGEGDAIHGSR